LTVFWQTATPSLQETLHFGCPETGHSTSLDSLELPKITLSKSLTEQLHLQPPLLLQ
jgi:hypothetical protein